MLDYDDEYYKAEQRRIIFIFEPPFSHKGFIHIKPTSSTITILLGFPYTFDLQAIHLTNYTKKKRHIVTRGRNRIKSKVYSL